jgi:NB-ARC domain-containing protein
LGKSVDFGNSLLIQRPLFVVPPGFHPNDSFFGMQKELTELHTRLFKVKKRAERVMAVVICGGPGSGKTHLARQYVHLYRGDYTGGIFWIDAKSRYSASMCFWDIAQAMTLTDGREFNEPRTDNSERHVDAVRKWFETRENWLLIFDGISFHGDEDINVFRHFLPFSKNSSIIYTSVDQTLRKKTRLFEPYCLTVQKLAVDDALALLFKDLGIKKPTQEQLKKATEVVEYYECLPLAIHAISHRLSATSQPIEKYHIHSHLTDMKLAEPFRNIMDDLFNRNYIAALNLINLLSFFGHHVPVGLILLGRPALAADKVEILSNSQSGDRGDIDTTLGVLIRYGLIERVSDPYVASLMVKTSQEQEDQSASSFELSESTDSTRIAPPAVYQSFVDTIKIHSVVQGFCRDELKIQDQNDGFGDSSSKDSAGHVAKQRPGRYYSWLTVAVRILVKSYETAIEKSKSSGDPPLIKDYREYETQAERLLEHFPKKIPLYPSIVPDAHDKLKQVLKSIKRELDKLSPSSSEEPSRHEKSIFDRSSSSSSAPDSSTEEGLSRRSTWNLDDHVAIHVESPLEDVPPPGKLDLFPPHNIYKETLNEKDRGYESDSENLKPSRRVSPARSETSQATETPKIPLSERYQVNEPSWQLVKRPLKTRASSVDRRRQYRNKMPRNLGSYRPTPTLTKLSSAQGQGSLSSVANVSVGASANNTDARTLLAAVHHSSPPPSRGGIIKAIMGRGRSQDQNQQTYASIVANGQRSPVPVPVSSPPPERGSPGLKRKMAKKSQDSLTSLSSDAHPSPVESRPTQFLALARSDPGLVPEHHLRPERNSEPGSQLHSRHPSVSRVNDITTDLPWSAPYPLADSNFPPLPFDDDISVTRIRQPSPFRSTTRTLDPNAHPSAIMPGASPPQSIPGGYMSEPMSYDTSRQSHESWQTESASYSHTPGLSQARPLYNYSQHVVPQDQAIYETGAWVPNLKENRATESDPYMTRGRSSPGTFRPATMLFGQHEVDIFAARQRVREENERERMPSPRPAPVSSPKLDITRQQENIPTRFRSSSSPARPDLTGLGLEY